MRGKKNKKLRLFFQNPKMLKIGSDLKEGVVQNTLNTMVIKKNTNLIQLKTNSVKNYT